MNKFFTFATVSIMLVGCAARSTTVETACQETLRPVTGTVDTVKQNVTVERVRGTVVEGSVWVWNEAAQAYEWLTSEQNRDRAARAREATKEAATGVYHKAVQTYNESK